jgi:hypothetical protein
VVKYKDLAGKPAQMDNNSNDSLYGRGAKMPISKLSTHPNGVFKYGTGFYWMTFAGLIPQGTYFQVYR